MANTKTNVSVGKPKIAGSVYRAPAGTAVPTDATSTLAEAFVSLGYISEDGMTNTRSFDADVIREWGGDPVYEAETNQEDTFKFTLIESLNPDVQKAVHNDDNVTGALSTGMTVEVNGDEHKPAAWVIEMIMRNNALKRICIPDASIIEVGEIVYRRSEAVGYPITLRAHADASGNYHYEYMKAAST